MRKSFLSHYSVLAMFIWLTNSFLTVSAEQILCSDEWYRTTENKVPTGDGQGHGPDIGSDEWKSVIEFKLGIRGKHDIPKRDSNAWCEHINQLISKNAPPQPKETNTPSFPCNKVESQSIEAMICNDANLSVLDQKLADVYSSATKEAVNEHPPTLKAEQRGWIKGRNECWKSDDKSACIRTAYQQRIAELQAKYHLVASTGPIFYTCDGNATNEVVVTFFETNPSTLIAEYGDSVSLMYEEPSESGSKYSGSNETFWEHQNTAIVQWGYGAKKMNCSKK